MGHGWSEGDCGKERTVEPILFEAIEFLLLEDAFLRVNEKRQ
jgi:hypothetical protein